MAAVRPVPPTETQPLKNERLLVLLLLVFFVVLVARRAWVCDDAYITFRTVDNLINGYRLTWNVTERVQAFTHPLWMLVLSGLYWLTREIHLTSIFLSMGISLLSVLALARRLALSEFGAAIGIFILSFSKAFVDYSTSGLENPLSHLLLAAFFIVYFSDRAPGQATPAWLLKLSLTASLVIFNRMDVGLVVLPALLTAVWRVWRSAALQTQKPVRRVGMILRALLVGQLPFLLWEVFATWYYGFPFPNTAYAKLNTGIPSWEYIRQGFLYFLDSIRFDPLTLVVILTAAGAVFLNRERPAVPLLIGMLAYLAYILEVGGDFMSGRFLTVPLFCAVILLARLDYRQLSTPGRVAVFGLALVLAVSVQDPTFRINDHGPIDSGPVHVGANGMFDERLLYYGGTGLLNSRRDQALPDFYWAYQGEAARNEGYKVVPRDGIGLFAFFAGPQVYVLDQLALADPLLARLPAEHKVAWRIGHMRRTLPEGYRQTLELGKNSISDPDLALYYDKLSVLTKGSLSDPGRLLEILKFNTGQYNYLINQRAYQYPTLKQANLTQFDRVFENGVPCTQKGVTELDDSGIQIDLGTESHASNVELSLDHDDRYRIVFMKQNLEVADIDISTRRLPDPGGLSLRQLSVPRQAAAAGYDRLWILPLTDTAPYCLGHLTLNP